MTQLRFEREVKPYAEPITATELRSETVYFFVHFADEDMLIPTMQAVVFVGENLDEGDEDQVYFQDIDSFDRGVRYGDKADGDYVLFHKGSRNELGHVFTFEHALDVLIACSLRHQKTKSLRSG